MIAVPHDQGTNTLVVDDGQFYDATSGPWALGVFGMRTAKSSVCAIVLALVVLVAPRCHAQSSIEASDITVASGVIVTTRSGNLLSMAEHQSHERLPAVAVSWSSIRAALNQSVCLVVDPQTGRRTRVFGDRRRCGFSPPTTPVEEAVESGIREALPLLVSVPPFFEIVLGEPPPRDDSQTDRGRRLGGQVVQSEQFLQAVLPWISEALAARGLCCVDCPTSDPLPVRMTWSQFWPYVTTFIHASFNEDPWGGEPRLSFRLCSGAGKAVEAYQPQDVNVYRAAFLSAYHSQTLREKIHGHLESITSDPGIWAVEGLKITDDILNRRLYDVLGRDPLVQADLCASLAAFSRHLGVEVIECLHF